jgi:hypothetical protein
MSTLNDVPLVTIDMQIRPIVQQMIHRLLISDEEMKAAIVAAANEAVSNFDWQAELKQTVQNTLKTEVEKLMRDLIRRLEYDQELKPLFIKMMTQIVEQKMKEGW